LFREVVKKGYLLNNINLSTIPDIIQDAINQAVLDANTAVVTEMCSLITQLCQISAPHISLTSKTHKELESKIYQKRRNFPSAAIYVCIT